MTESIPGIKTSAEETEREKAKTLAKINQFEALVDSPMDMLAESLTILNEQHEEIHVKIEARRMILMFRSQGLSKEQILEVSARSRRIVNGEEKAPEERPDVIDVILDILQRRR